MPVLNLLAKFAYKSFDVILIVASRGLFCYCSVLQAKICEIVDFLPSCNLRFRTRNCLCCLKATRK